MLGTLRSHKPWSCEEEDVLSDLFHLHGCDPKFDTGQGPAQGRVVHKLHRSDSSRFNFSEYSPGSPGKHDDDSMSNIDGCGSIAIQSRLNFVAKEGRARRRRISIPVFAVGVTLFVFLAIAAFSYYAAETSVLREICYSIIWGSSPFVVFFMLLALLPSDTRLVPCTLYFTLSAYVFLGFIYTQRAVYEYQDARASGCVATVFEDYIEKDVPCWARWCTYGCFLITLGNVYFIIFSFGSSMRRNWYTKSHDRSREFLILVWWSQFRHHAYQGVVSIFYAILVFASGNYANSLSQAFPGICGLFVGVLSLPRLGTRKRIQSWLASRSESAAVAAGIAELLGDRNVQDIIIAAKDNFTYVSLESVTFEDMAEQTPNKDLSKLARKARLGEIDAFVSHSWHDAIDAKWKVLQRWREEFKTKNRGREPKLWIDKYCIDQDNIEESLMGGQLENLEVRFVSAAEDVGVGPTASLKEALGNFDPSTACCVSEYDTNRLHAVIEASSMGMEGIKGFVQNVFLGYEKRLSDFFSA